MRKGWIWGLMAAGLATGPATAASWSALPAPWIVNPMDAACRVDLDLAARSGAVVPVSLVSDGDNLRMRFVKEDIPERAFLPLRIDQKPYSNLSERAERPTIGSMLLSDETVAALARGKTLQVAWLSTEILSASLAGSERGLSDLRICGAQVAAQHRQRMAAEADARARTASEARAKALADEQMAAAQAQRAAAEAERERVAAEAARMQAEADAERQRQAYEAESVARAEMDRRLADEEAARQRAYRTQYEEEMVYPRRAYGARWGYYEPGY